jgi:hypothetical protein
MQMKSTISIKPATTVRRRISDRDVIGSFDETRADKDGGSTGDSATEERRQRLQNKEAGPPAVERAKLGARIGKEPSRSPTQQVRCGYPGGFNGQKKKSGHKNAKAVDCHGRPLDCRETAAWLKSLINAPSRTLDQQPVRR